MQHIMELVNQRKAQDNLQMNILNQMQIPQNIETQVNSPQSQLREILQTHLGVSGNETPGTKETS